MNIRFWAALLVISTLPELAIAGTTGFVANFSTDSVHGKVSGVPALRIRATDGSGAILVEAGLAQSWNEAQTICTGLNPAGATYHVSTPAEALAMEKLGLNDTQSLKLDSKNEVLLSWVSPDSSDTDHLGQTLPDTRLIMAAMDPDRAALIDLKFLQNGMTAQTTDVLEMALAKAYSDPESRASISAQLKDGLQVFCVLELDK